MHGYNILTTRYLGFSFAPGEGGRNFYVAQKNREVIERTTAGRWLPRVCKAFDAWLEYLLCAKHAR